MNFVGKSINKFDTTCYILLGTTMNNCKENLKVRKKKEKERRYL